MSDSINSGWDESTELRCLIIFKRLYVEDFPRGRHVQYCRELSKELNISAERLSARVTDYKTAAGMNAASEAPAKAVRLYKKYRHTSIGELEEMAARY